MEDIVTIPEFFKDKKVFITGGSGFIGKALIEKLLRCSPGLSTIYLLIRSKRNQNAQERVKTIMNNEIFDAVRKSNPEFLQKVVAVSGDVIELELGLNEEDKKLVLSSHIVFHVAASVRFDDSLRKATLMNTRGTREVMELMLQMPNLVVGVHVSTAYCNTDKEVIEEKIYRDHGDWRQAIKIAERFQDDYKLECLTAKCLRGMKNTYIYTKHLAENVVEDYSDRLPLVVYRPGVVVSTWKDPIPGWTDNINGPIGLNVASGKGFLRVIRANPDMIVDDMPVDLVVNGLVVATWKKGVKKDSENLPVYNCTMEEFLRHTHRHVRDVSLKMISNYPYNGTLWYPFCDFTRNKLLFRIKFLLYNALVAVVVDGLLKAVGRKPMLGKLTRKSYAAIMAVSYFILKNWDFKSKNFTNLNKELEPSDRKDYLVDASSLDVYDYMVNARIGTSKYLLRENIDLQAARFHYKWLKALHYTLKYAFWALVLYYFILPRVMAKIQTHLT